LGKLEQALMTSIDDGLVELASVAEELEKLALLHLAEGFVKLALLQRLLQSMRLHCIGP
jgi:hypothetical protein